MAVVPQVSLPAAGAVSGVVPDAVDYLLDTEPVFFSVLNRPHRNLAHRDNQISTVLDLLVEEFDHAFGRQPDGSVYAAGPLVTNSELGQQVPLTALEDMLAVSFNANGTLKSAAVPGSHDPVTLGPVAGAGDYLTLAGQELDVLADDPVTPNGLQGQVVDSSDVRVHNFGATDPLNTDHDGRYYTEAEIGDDGASPGPNSGASLVGYDNTASGLVAATVQSAIDEVAANTTASGIAGGRLAISPNDPEWLSSGLSSTLYYVPYAGNRITLWDGDAGGVVGGLVTKTITLKTIAVGGLLANRIYDVFAEVTGAGPLDWTLTTEAWTDDTVRAVALASAIFDGAGSSGGGMLFDSTDVTRRYLGSFRTDGTPQVPVKNALRTWLWNYHNQIPQEMTSQDTTASWTGGASGVAASVWEPMNSGDADWIHDVLIGVRAVLEVEATVAGQVHIPGGSPRTAAGIVLAINSTTTPHASAMGMFARGAEAGVAWFAPLRAFLKHQFDATAANSGRATVRALGNTASNTEPGGPPSYRSQMAARLNPGDGELTVQTAGMVSRWTA